MMEYIESFDRELFLYLNGLHSPLLDSIMYWVSQKYTWIPLYAILMVPLWKVYGRKIFVPLTAVVLLITLSDQISVHFFKNVFQRYRPCHNELIAESVHLLKNKCGGQFGFVSSHATNTFALATFLYLQFRRPHNNWAYLLFIWAAIVSYSRIYLGVHYPADVAGGALLGIVLALVVNRFVERLNSSLNLKST